MIYSFSPLFRPECTLVPRTLCGQSPGYLMPGFEINARPINGFVVSTVEQSEEGTGLSVGEYVHGFLPWQEFNVTDAKVGMRESAITA